MSNVSWGPRNWGGQWKSWLALNEFVGTDWKTAIKVLKWDDPRRAASLGSQYKTEAQELAELVRLMQDERNDALGEIVAQDVLYERFAVFFLRLLRITPVSHAATCTLLHVAGLIGLVTVMHFKNEFNRPRPSQYLPVLNPPVSVPGHPAFPSGHATQSLLMAEFVLAAMGRATKNAATLQAEWRPYLHTLAFRMGRNREIAGLHFHSDSQGGYDLADEVMRFLAAKFGLGQCTYISGLIDDAAAEW